MEWWLSIIVLFGALIMLLAIGVPVAFAFMAINVAGAFFIMGGWHGVSAVIPGMFTSLTTFTLLPVPLFILMGEAMFHSEIGNNAIDVIDKWLGRLPGGISLMAIVSGTLFAALSGSTIANAALLGTTLMPEMVRRGYAKSMAIGPIIGAGGLAMLIPPSALAVVWASLAYVSVGKMLIAGVIPGILVAFLYAGYVVLRCLLNPTLAPRQERARIALSEKIVLTVKYILPMGVIIFLVVGIIFLGIATATEAAATGALGTIVMVAAYGRLSRAVMRKVSIGTIRVTGMVLMIILASQTFSQLLSFCGATRGLVEFVVNLGISKMVFLTAVMLILLFLGCFLEQASIMMVTIPIFMPVVKVLGIEPIWFGVLFLINLEVGLITPPFGLLLFVMKGVAPVDVTMIDIWRAAIPFVICDCIALAVVMAFPMMALWLPGMGT